MEFTMTSRRRFIQIVPLVGASMLGAGSASAQLVTEKDAQAIALGYVSDAANVNKAKYKQYATGQTCSSCALYQAKSSDPTAACALFPGKQVAGKGWCSAYAKKP
jgi:hypothetical protein